MDAGIAEDPRHLLRVTGLEVMVPEHGDDGQPHRLEIPTELLSLVFRPAVGQVATQDEDVSSLADAGERLCHSR
jgi:hypothetical protein